MDFTEDDDGEGVKDSPDSPENLEDCGWRVENELSAGQKGSCASTSLATTTADTSTSSLGAPVGFALGRAQPIRRPGSARFPSMTTAVAGVDGRQKYFCPNRSLAMITSPFFEFFRVPLSDQEQTLFFLGL